MIPFQDLKRTNAPHLDRLVAAAERVIRSGRYINGQEVAAFEKALAERHGAKYCVAVSTGLDALRLILLAYKETGRLRDGDEVIVPANTFIATFLAVTSTGLTAVAADVDADTYCLDFRRLPLTEKTKAVIPVHLFGTPCWNAEILDGLHKEGILVIEDDAQAIGAVSAEEGFHGSRLTGNLGDAAAISFYPAKNIGALGDAGAVLTNDATLAAAVRQIANYGAEEKYFHDLCGFNCRMDEMQAALLSVKLPALDEITERRTRNAGAYDRLITNPYVVKPQFPGSPGERRVWHQYVIRHPERDRLKQFLAENGVSTEIHYPIACHRQKCYEENPALTAYGTLETAEYLASRILSLPIADASPEEIEKTASLINSFS